MYHISCNCNTLKIPIHFFVKHQLFYIVFKNGRQTWWVNKKKYRLEINKNNNNNSREKKTKKPIKKFEQNLKFISIFIFPILCSNNSIQFAISVILFFFFFSSFGFVMELLKLACSYFFKFIIVVPLFSFSFFFSLSFSLSYLHYLFLVVWILLFQFKKKLYFDIAIINKSVNISRKFVSKFRTSFASVLWIWVYIN